MVFLVAGKLNFIVKTSSVAQGGRYLFSKSADLKLVLLAVVVATPSPCFLSSRSPAPSTMNSETSLFVNLIFCLLAFLS